MKSRVVIAGAGPTGLLLACELQRLGAEVLIVDPKSGPTRESRAMFVHARTLEIYQQLGLGDEAVTRGHPARGVSVWGPQGRAGGFAWGPVGAGRTPYPFILAFEQSANEALLYDKLRALGGEVLWGWSLETFEQDAQGVTVSLTGPARGAREVRALYLCGADGAHSLVRHSLGTPFEGGNSPRTLFVADVTATGALDSADLNVKLSPDSLLLIFPMKGRDNYRLIGMAPGRELETETPTFEAVRPLLRDNFGLEVSEVRWFSHYRVSHRVARQFQTGRVFLLGDAAHVHSPVGGQGMNTGLGDAHNLAWKLAAVLRGDAGAELLASYTLERRPFAQRLVRTTDSMFSLTSGKNVIAQLQRRLLPRLLGWVLRGSKVTGADEARPNPAGKFAFSTLSQIRLSYPHSPLSGGQAGRVKGGERLPYVPGSGNFAALETAALQLHSYGEASAAVRAWCDSHGGVALHVFPYSAAARTAGLLENAVYLVRPDGYIGLAQAEFDGAALTEMLRERWHWRV